MSRKHLQNITGLLRNIESSPHVVNALSMWAPLVSTMLQRVINEQLRLKHTEGTWICCAARHCPSQIGSNGVWLMIPKNIYYMHNKHGYYVDHLRTLVYIRISTSTQSSSLASFTHTHTNPVALPLRYTHPSMTLWSSQIFHVCMFYTWLNLITHPGALAIVAYLRNQ